MHSAKVKCWEEENQKHWNVFAAFKFQVSILKMKMYFLKNCKGHLFYKCPF